MAKRRRPRRRRRRRKRRRGMPKQLFGNTQLVTHVWSHAGQLGTDATNTIGVMQAFRLNGFTDPLVSLGGTEPLGLAQIRPLFQNAQVVKALYSVNYMPDESQHGIAMFVEQSLVPKQNSPALTLNNILNGRNTSYRTYGSGRGFATTAGCTLRRTYNPRSFHGVKDLSDNELLICLNGNLPIKEAYFNLGHTSTHGATIAPLDYIVRIKYLVRWTYPVSPATT